MKESIESLDRSCLIWVVCICFHDTIQDVFGRVEGVSRSLYGCVSWEDVLVCSLWWMIQNVITCVRMSLEQIKNEKRVKRKFGFVKCSNVSNFNQ